MTRLLLAELACGCVAIAVSAGGCASPYSGLSDLAGRERDFYRELCSAKRVKIVTKTVSSTEEVLIIWKKSEPPGNPFDHENDTGKPQTLIKDSILRVLQRQGVTEDPTNYEILIGIEVEEPWVQTGRVLVPNYMPTVPAWSPAVGQKVLVPAHYEDLVPRWHQRVVLVVRIVSRSHQWNWWNEAWSDGTAERCIRINQKYLEGHPFFRWIGSTRK